MASRRFREASPDPVREQLVGVRLGLLRLHKTLIDTERAYFERRHGRMTSGQFLQALLQDPYFTWLRPYSGLIVEIDEALAADEPVTAQRARAFIEQVRALVELPEEEDVAPTSRYGELRRRDPDVLMAHVELTSRIAAALE